jgi:hypothetical protein
VRPRVVVRPSFCDTVRRLGWSLATSCWNPCPNLRGTPELGGGFRSPAAPVESSRAWPPHAADASRPSLAAAFWLCLRGGGFSKGEAQCGAGRGGALGACAGCERIEGARRGERVCTGPRPLVELVVRAVAHRVHAHVVVRRGAAPAHALALLAEQLGADRVRVHVPIRARACIHPRHRNVCELISFGGETFNASA